VNEIIITRINTGYIAMFCGGDMAGITVPTPHTPAAPIEMVIREVQALNLEYKVIAG